MATLPRLRDVFGVPIDQIDAGAIASAINRQAPESEQLDWKRDPYRKGDSKELAKDIAGMANGIGGVIVLGVAQDEHSRAASPEPFTDSVDTLTGMVSEIRQRRIRPFITDLAVIPVPANDDQTEHFMAIVVGRSFDAPHAVMPESPTASTLEFPLRRMTTTEWLKEDQVAALYRTRFTARTNSDTAVDSLIAGHTRRGYNSGPQHSVIVAAVPTTPGYREPGVAARTAEFGFALNWSSYRTIPGAPLTVSPNEAARRVFPEVQKTRIICPAATLVLGHDGSTLVAQEITGIDGHVVNMRTQLHNTGARFAIWGSTDEVEWALFTGLAYAVDHALDAGASGDLAIRAQLMVGETPNMGAFGGLARYAPRTPGGVKYEVPETSGPAQSTSPVSGSVGISAGADYRAIASAAFTLGTDILAEFGIDEPRLFSLDGWTSTDYLGPNLRTAAVGQWAREHVNIDT